MEVMNTNFIRAPPQIKIRASADGVDGTAGINFNSPLVYKKGPVLGHANVYVVFWGAFTSAMEQQILQWYPDMLSSTCHST